MQTEFPRENARPIKVDGYMKKVDVSDHLWQSLIQRKFTFHRAAEQMVKRDTWTV